MFSSIYYSLPKDVWYHAYYDFSGSWCLIKKTADDVPLGFVTARFPCGKKVRRHFCFFAIGNRAEDTE